jgi:acyl-CoA synthetase (AMP-forming)/AMP-acid ligase II
VGGLQNLGSALQSGATIACQPKPDAEAALALIERTRATMVIAWANTIQRLRAAPSFATRDLSAVPQLTMAGGDPELRHNSLGMTETIGPHTGFARPGAPAEEQAMPLPERLRGSWGAPLPFIQHKIVDPMSGGDLADGEEGEICVRGYCLMTRMYKRERHEVFDRDGWYHTGDRGFLRDGYLFFTGRLTEMIKTHGANVSPREVELVLEAQPDVAQAYVMGVPDAERGEQVAAVIVPVDEGPPDVDDLRRRLSAELSSYKVPRRFVVLRDDEVPWLASGKADRLSIRDLLSRST